VGAVSPVLLLALELTMAAQPGRAQDTTVNDLLLPDDAAPYSEQIYRVPCDNTRNETTFDFATSVYQQFGCLPDLFGDTLVDLDKEFNPLPASAESWSVADDGVTWTFKLREGLMWSDGTPVTAHDYVATFQLEATPDHGWDFSWFYSFIGKGGIRNWTSIVEGKLAPEELGVRAVDDLTLEVITEGPFPPLPSVMKFSFVLQKRALEEHGPFYNSDVATSVSSGPYVLVEFDPGNRIVVEANPAYTGYRPARLSRIEGIYMSPATFFIAFENGEVDMVTYDALTPTDYALIERDPGLTENYLKHAGNFRTDYLIFDTFTPPFDNLDVRKAFAHALDREIIVAHIFGEIKAMPAHSMLMPGFPSADTEGVLADFQRFDCDLARQHLAAAGFPDGEGFPPQEMWLRGEGPAMSAVYQASAASIAQCLNIEIQVSNKDSKVYMDALNARPTQVKLGAVSYGMDFLDPTNLLGIWVSSGRHSWHNEEFDGIVRAASNMVDDPERRDRLFRDAERILVDDVGGLFIAHRLQGDLFKPYVLGNSLREPDANGGLGRHWGNDWHWGDIYIGRRP
jgi:peptide/nickel transport system substrate-binding protein/oligopeptide transport system substrate-binding protein